MAQESIRVQLDFPLEQVTQPIIYHLVVDHHLIPNIRRANIDAHTGGMMVLELDGERANLETGVAYLRGLNIEVTDVGAGTSWTI